MANSNRYLAVYSETGVRLKKCTKCLEYKDYFNDFRFRSKWPIDRCKECAKKYSNQYYHDPKNKTRILENQKVYDSKHKEQHNIAARTYVLNNPDLVRLSKRKWASNNKESIRAAKVNRRYNKKTGKDGKVSQEFIRWLYHEQNGKCVACLKDLANCYHVDHRVPIVKGGSNTNKNIDLLCPKCNLEKNDSDPLIFMRKKGWLL